MHWLGAVMPRHEYTMLIGSALIVVRLTVTQLDIKRAAAWMRDGQILAYPTEAVWGLGCDPLNQQAVQQILDLKTRPVDKGVILIAASIEQVEPLLVGLTAQQRDQVVSSWPAPLTWLLPLSPSVPTWICGAHDRVAVRVSAHPVVQALCLAFGGPIVSTSANPAGQVEARTADQVHAYFGSAVPCVAGEVGGALQPSQIKDALTGQVLRGA